MNLSARNERLKLTANWLNGSAIAAIAVGAFAPITSVIVGSARVALVDLAVLFVGWLLVSVSLHVSARFLLRRLEEP